MLTEKAISGLKGQDKVYRVSDSGGLYVEVKPDGSKYWRQAYRFAGKQKTLAHGVYPEIGLKEARRRRDDAKTLLDQNIDPAQQRKIEKLTAKLSAANTFAAVARDWHENRADGLSQKTANKTIAALETHVFPKLGALPVDSIEPAHILAVIIPIDKGGNGETARRVRAWIDAVFRYAIQHGKIKINPAAELRSSEVFKPSKEKHLASLPVVQLSEFMRSIDEPAKRVDYRTRLAIRLLLLTFVRPGELNWAMWGEFNIEAKEWRIPAERIEGQGKGMKMREEHIVPLSDQAIAVLDLLRPLTGHSKFLFPCIGRPSDAGMSENTLRKAIQTGLGFAVTAHGMRATATSALLELGWPAHVIDKQLAHRERRGASFGAYSHQAEYLPERRKMMQAWGDHLHALECGTNVVAIKNKAA